MKTELIKELGESGELTETNMVFITEVINSVLDKHYKSQWLTPEAAPKDRVFIGRFKHWPLPMATCWSDPQKQYVASAMHVDLYHGAWNDTYFENEWEDKNDLIAWMPMPNFADNDEQA